MFCAGGVGLERCDLCGWLCGVWGSLANCCVVLMRSSCAERHTTSAHCSLGGRYMSKDGATLAASPGRCRHIHRKEGHPHTTLFVG